LLDFYRFTSDLQEKVEKQPGRAMLVMEGSYELPGGGALSWGVGVYFEKRLKND